MFKAFSQRCEKTTTTLFRPERYRHQLCLMSHFCLFSPAPVSTAIRVCIRCVPFPTTTHRTAHHLPPLSPLETRQASDKHSNACATIGAVSRNAPVATEARATNTHTPSIPFTQKVIEAYKRALSAVVTAAPPLRLRFARLARPPHCFDHLLRALSRARPSHALEPSCAVEVGLTTINTNTRTFENPKTKNKKQSTHNLHTLPSWWFVAALTHADARLRHPVVSSASIPHTFAYHITHTHTLSIRPASAQTKRRGSSRV